jgi:Uma2 family endonuclease
MALALKRLFTVDEYHRMADFGILGEDDRVELIEGEILVMSPIGTRHAACVDRLTRLLVQGARERAIVRVQNPVQLGERSEPQPDVALLKASPDFYAARHPGPRDVILIVEVADASVVYDREVKVPLYARAGLPEVWLVDLAGEAVDVHRLPSERGYRDVRRLSRGQSLAVQGLPGLALQVDQILG